MQSSFRSPFIVALSRVKCSALLRLYCRVSCKCVTQSGTELAYRHIAFVVFVHKPRQVVNIVLGQHLQTIDSKFKSAQVYQFCLLRIKFLQKALWLLLHNFKFVSHIDQTFSRLDCITLLFKLGSQQFNKRLLSDLLSSVFILEVVFYCSYFFIVKCYAMITNQRVSQLLSRQPLVFIFVILIKQQRNVYIEFLYFRGKWLDYVFYVYVKV